MGQVFFGYARSCAAGEKCMRRILIVDDEPRITEAFREAFGHDYDVLTAHEGEKAMQLIKDSKPELVVLDWRLRGEIDGYDVLIFTKREFPALPVYVVTASVQYVKEIASAGADDCLLKPCGDLLKEKIRSVLPPQ